MDFQQLANDILKDILSRSAVEAEIYLVMNRSTKIDVQERQIESIDELTEAGLALRLVKNCQLGFSYASLTDEQPVDSCIEQALANAAVAAADKFNRLPSPLPAGEKFSTFDPGLAAASLKEKIRLALRLEETAYQFNEKIKKTQKAFYLDNAYEVWIQNTNGVKVNYKGNYCGLYAELISARDGEMESGLAMDYAVKIAELDPQKTGREAAQKAVEMLGAKPIPSQKIDLVIDPSVGAQLLEILANSLSAEAVQKGKSLFAGKIGKMIGTSCLDILDDGQLENGIASSPYDAEGIPTRKTVLVESGILQSFLHNTYSAAKIDTNSTGNAVRPSFKNFPSIGHSNLYIKNGKIPAEKIIKSLHKGLYVTRVMGLHTANPITGDFSIGADGFLIENGERSFPVRGVTIAGNLIDILMSIEIIGSDLRFFANLGSPTLLLPKISVSGT